MEKTSEVLNGCIEKIKVSSAEIVVHGTKDKPYYEIKYRDLSDGQIHEGYSSYNLDYVFGWLEECFEIMHEKDADRMSISEQVKKLRDISASFDRGIPNPICQILNEAADTIESLFEKLQAANMERSVDCGGWIPCKDRLPEEKGWYLVYAKNQRPFVAYFKGKTFPLNNHYHEIIAWQPLPEPYHEP